MEIAIVVGNNSKKSYNLKLAQYMKNRYEGPLSINIVSISKLPLFSVDDLTSGRIDAEVEIFYEKIAAADGVVIVTPEYNHSVPAILKNALEWMSKDFYPFINKPVMIAGCAYGALGTVRAQMALRGIINSPGLQANVMPGNEFLLTFAEEKFDANGDLIDEGTIKFLDQCFLSFVRFTGESKY